MLAAEPAAERTVYLSKPSYTSAEITEISGVGEQTLTKARQSGDLIGARLGLQYVHPATRVAKWLTSRSNGEIVFVATSGGER